MIWERHFPLRAQPKPRPSNNAMSWHVRARHFKRFRDTVRMLVGPEDGVIKDGTVSVRIILYDWESKADPDNLAGGVLDCLKPWPLPDDSLKYIAYLSVLRSARPDPGAGFTVTIEPWTPKA